MPDWLHASVQPDAEVTFTLVAVRLVIALVLGSVIAGVYRLTHGKTADEPGALSATLVLLTVIIAMVAMAIGDNIARAFSLVGALAIVRFRTVVEDTRDTAFVIFAVAVGLAVGAGSTQIPLVGIPVVAIAAFLFRPPAASIANASAGELRLRVGLAAAQPAALGANPGRAPRHAATHFHRHGPTGHGDRLRLPGLAAQSPTDWWHSSLHSMAATACKKSNTGRRSGGPSASKSCRPAFC